MIDLRTFEKGQILVLLALVLVGLLGFTALAVDGGMIFADRRYMQSSADAASLAGAGAVASGVQGLEMTSAEFECGPLASSIASAYTTAITKASANDFTIGQENSLGTGGVNNGVKITCDAAGEFVDVFVMLTRDTTTSFVHLFNGGPMRNTVSSVTRVKPGLNAGDGSAIVSLSKNCAPSAAKTEGVWISGSNSTFLLNGGIYSNSCVDRSGAAVVDITNGSVEYHDGYAHKGFSDPLPIPDTEYHKLTYNPLPSPGDSCSTTDPYDDLKFTTLDAGETEKLINPGNYDDWDFKVPVKLTSGLYCIKGTVKMDASAYVFIEKQTGGEGPGVTLFYTGTDLTINGGSDTEIAAPNGYDDPTDPPPGGAVEDLLLYIPPGTVATVKINGGSDNTWGGTLYMPDSFVKINGTSDSSSQTDMYVSIIGYGITISGDSYLNLVYDADRDYGMTSYLQVQK